MNHPVPLSKVRPAHGRARRRRLWLLAAIPLIPVVVVAGLGLEIYRYSFRSDAGDADAAIVLGSALMDGQPSPVFRERINHAINLYRGGQVKAIIFTGGVGWGSQTVESVAASHYAVDRGVPPEDVYCEASSRITWENLIGARQIVQQNGWRRVLVVSDPLHMRRAMTMARDLGLEAHPSPTPTTRYTTLESKLPFLMREIRFYGLYLIQRPFVAAAPLPEMVTFPYRARSSTQSQ